jgi:outer membrane beta-barrel protein
MRAYRSLLALLVALIAASVANPVLAGTKPARQALEEFKGNNKPLNVVQNRFILKTNRFELAPVVGYVPNNPFVKRYTGGMLIAYHFSEVLAAEGAIIYSPDLGENDLKDLTHTLVGIAEDGSGEVDFQQPIDKMILGATFAARWAPVYGKISLIGERVLNFDFYGVAGLGMLSINSYYATYNDEFDPPTKIETPQNKVKVPINLGIGMDFFLTQSLAIKIDARNYFYVDYKPLYDPDAKVVEKRLYNNFVASVGVSVFFPGMPQRRLDF